MVTERQPSVCRRTTALRVSWWGPAPASPPSEASGSRDCSTTNTKVGRHSRVSESPAASQLEDCHSQEVSQNQISLEKQFRAVTLELGRGRFEQ